MEFSRPEYWNGDTSPSQVDLPDPGIKPGSPALQVDSLPTKISGKPQPCQGTSEKPCGTDVSMMVVEQGRGWGIYSQISVLTDFVSAGMNSPTSPCCDCVWQTRLPCWRKSSARKADRHRCLSWEANRC